MKFFPSRNFVASRAYQSSVAMAGVCELLPRIIRVSIPLFCSYSVPNTTKIMRQQYNLTDYECMILDDEVLT